MLCRQHHGRWPKLERRQQREGWGSTSSKELGRSSHSCLQIPERKGEKGWIQALFCGVQSQEKWHWAKPEHRRFPWPSGGTCVLPAAARGGASKQCLSGTFLSLMLPLPKFGLFFFLLPKTSFNYSTNICFIIAREWRKKKGDLKEIQSNDTSQKWLFM